MMRFLRSRKYRHARVLASVLVWLFLGWLFLPITP